MIVLDRARARPAPPPAAVAGPAQPAAAAGRLARCSTRCGARSAASAAASAAARRSTTTMLGDRRRSSTSRVAWWPPLDAADGARLAARPRVPGPGRRGRARAPRSSGCSPKSWAGDGDLSVEDVPLLDELRYALGDVPDAHRRRARRSTTTSLARVRRRHAGADAPRPTASTPGRAAWTPPTNRIEDDGYAHVLVDEAQDLTPMQWRMVGRRGRAATWTIVGDPAQSSWPVPGGGGRGPGRGARGTRSVHEFHLSTNYRNSAEIYDYAAAYAERVGLDADLPDAVRSTGVAPRGAGRHRPRGGASATRSPRSPARVEGTVGDRRAGRPPGRGRTPGWRRGRSSPTTPPTPAAPAAVRRGPGRGAHRPRHQGPGVRRHRGGRARRRSRPSRPPAARRCTSCSPAPPSGWSPSAAVDARLAGRGVPSYGGRHREADAQRTTAAGAGALGERALLVGQHEVGPSAPPPRRVRGASAPGRRWGRSGTRSAAGRRACRRSPGCWLQATRPHEIGQHQPERASRAPRCRPTPAACRRSPAAAAGHRPPWRARSAAATGRAGRFATSTAPKRGVRRGSSNEARRVTWSKTPQNASIATWAGWSSGRPDSCRCAVDRGDRSDELVRQRWRAARAGRAPPGPARRAPVPPGAGRGRGRSSSRARGPCLARRRAPRRSRGAGCCASAPAARRRPRPPATG